jgi:hypothetical protein
VFARWDGDERGRGVASARAGVDQLDRLRSAMVLPDWVAEAPDLHLLPHVERVCEANGWRILLAHVADGVLEVDVTTAAQSRGELRAAAFVLIGSFAEASTHVVATSPDDSSVEVTVTTGMLEGDGAFAPHGHVVRLALRAA